VQAETTEIEAICSIRDWFKPLQTKTNT